MQITLNNPLDMHLHLREGALLKAILPFSAVPFSAAVVMPNLSTPLSTPALALEYQAQIATLAPRFKPLVALYLNDQLDKESLQSAKEQGLFLLKLYPKNATTNSVQGVGDILSPKILEILQVAQDLGFILCVHAESTGFVLEREFEFHTTIHTLAATFKNLKIILEHMSDRRSIALLEQYPNIYATLTLHHLALNLDALAGGALLPHLFCKPLLKTPKDQQALLELALTAHKKVSFGSDSAPHLTGTKHTYSCAAGVFSAPLLLSGLCTLFEQHNALEHLQDFISTNAMRIYGLTDLPQKSITLERKPPNLPNFLLNGDLIIPHFIPLEWRIQST
ncbi:dihydroorotase [Helicobacter heilmannii]|uniref:Dihydroorotase n=1 Tax=Helicobacter heilmannii TaxID=35817 RepID=A0A0K2Y928_HELHE|nr:dihydroorotase [Helicobacter heilmannii]CCM12182.1 Dihydroorotase [Helicobacter heilmannii ASB1.4]CRF46463.1 Dihydroorotase [Helicobacter heilmannii]CRF49833.1 Dihydroorotase [Helicobacter heilmannii]CRF50492.1 Dihydroorotase [Helicobacter heilmannii]CRI34189.1 Dihydroorotase [Helicobacter heilmannii]